MLRPSGSQWTHKDKYIDQMIFVNEQMVNIVDSIISQSEKEPLIIIQADHGTSTVLGWEDNPDEERLNERSNIFNAYYLPNSSKNIIYDTITPVNSFRVILNEYFNQSLDILEDKTYFSNYGSTPYKFVLIFENDSYVGPYKEIKEESNTPLLPDN